MHTLFLIVWYLLLFTFLIALTYVSGTYLLLAYDRCLARNHLISPSYLNRAVFPRGWPLIRGIIGEILAIWFVIWTYPLAMIFRHPWRVTKNQRRPIILIHGYKHNQSGWLPMRHRLKRAGLGPIYSLNLRLNRGGIPSCAEQVAALAQKIEKKTGMREVILVGHSMGGLVAAYYAECLAPPDKVSHLITIASPLHGTRLAVINFGRTARQMRPGSAFLRDLEWRISSDGFTRYHHIATHLDNMIFPYQSALREVEPRYQMILRWQGHMTLIFSKKVSMQIISWLQSTAPQRTGLAQHRSKKQTAQTA